eukprot:TRINITY_DN52765_c0_g1_i2.p1 TRINITY_DN52765_c0_g1~~TRINITY_DN52765_c0_g1_i2.p1  ORF type:complete len:545 (+),score=34.55 TRINITY_DN52765_c0_g1_i2:46-1635(+)
MPLCNISDNIPTFFYTFPHFQAIISTVKRLHIPCMITEVELTQPGNSMQHEMFLAVIFQRWCDPTAVPLGGAYPLAGMLDQPTPLPTKTTEEWDKDISGWMEDTVKWHLLGNSLMRSVESRCLDHIREFAGSSTQANSEQEKRELMKFTRIPDQRMLDLLPKDAGQRGEMICKLSEVLTHHYTTLRNVYRYYASSDSSLDTTMSVQEFWRFCTDAKISTKQFDRTVVRSIFNEVNHPTPPPSDDKDKEKDANKEGKDNEKKREDVPFLEVSVTKPGGGLLDVAASSPPASGTLGVPTHTSKSRRTSVYAASDPKEKGKGPPTPGTSGLPKDVFQVAKMELLAEEWVESLVRIAHKKYRKHYETLPTALDHLINHNIVPHCLQVDVTEFKSQVYSERVQSVIGQYRGHLIDVFKSYGRNPGPGMPYEMTLEGYNRLLNDSSLCDEVFTHYAAQAIFQKIQEDDDISLMFHEFQEALVAIASFKQPAPYLPLSQRLESFLKVFFFPRLEHKFHWPDFHGAKRDRSASKAIL